MKNNHVSPAELKSGSTKESKLNISPDTSNMQMIEIDEKTKIFIPLSASAIKAKSRYLNYLRSKRKNSKS
jgi:hypothetical protein